MMIPQISAPEQASVQPEQSLIDLWDKAIESSEQLSAEERLRILERWPPDELDQQCWQRCGLAFDDLMRKAVESSTQLTGDEAYIILTGVHQHYSTAADKFLGRFQWPEELRRKRQTAMQLAELDRDRLARENAETARLRATTEKEAALARLSDEDKRNIRDCNKIPWVTEINVQPYPSWGFVMFRTDFSDDAEWAEFRKQVEDCVNTALCQVQDGDRIRQHWKIHYVEDKSLENATLSELRRRFNELLSASSVFSSARKDTFLVADTAAVESVLTSSPLPGRGWLLAADAMHDEGHQPKYKHGFEGMLKVSLTHVFITFFARLRPIDSDATSRDSPYQDFNQMYYKARYNRPAIAYPPDARLNRHWGQ